MTTRHRHPGATLGLTLGFLGLLGLVLAPGQASAQGALKSITFVQPNPSAINSFQVFVAIGEG